MRPTPNECLVRALRGLPGVEAQNRLMRLGDREVALAMMYMRDAERAALLALLPAPKVQRIREELALHRRLAIRYDQYVAAVAAVLSSLEGGSPAGFRSYLRPRTPGK